MLKRAGSKEMLQEMQEDNRCFLEEIDEAKVFVLLSRFPSGSIA